jgi:cell division septum initiation protein DivIVA
MIDLTPLDVRKKKGDFAKSLRGYEPAMVDAILELTAERLEEVVREKATLRERASKLTDQLESFRQREQAMNEALVSAQQLREEIRTQAAREVEMRMREAGAEAERIVAQAHRQAETAADAARRVHTARARVVRGFRAFLERQMSELDMEEERLRGAEPPSDPAAAERATRSDES